VRPPIDTVSYDISRRAFAKTGSTIIFPVCFFSFSQLRKERIISAVTINVLIGNFISMKIRI
jgi:hypothetical protein